MKLLLFSDVHCDLERARRLVHASKDVDAAIGAGDFASVHKGLDETIDALSAITCPTIVVPGNNETLDALQNACRGWSSCTVCHGSGLTIDGVPFFGLGGGIPPTPWEWSFDLSEADARHRLEPMTSNGVLVLHSPPLGHVDGGGNRHLGSQAILDAVLTRGPKLAVCGHIHECWGQESIAGRTRVVNAGPDGVIVEV
ncbi:MAG: serine/threonine protein phosphatase [Phycisphaerales bacterium]|nr:metallophosphoesterase family protein [Phycisphaerae bacterium]NNF42287.1 serine/threonine protein phosphatase [Phycisphaerales bacterium]NNM26943.1 serine/threonine protein phosphatase [Phycisphaerales bacterium]